jgi:putative membrane protein
MIVRYTSGWWFGLHLLGDMLRIAVLIVLVLALVRWFSRELPSHTNRPWNSSTQPLASPPDRLAMEILRQRYARGEIDAATFDQMRERVEASARADQQPSSSPHV